MNIPTPTVKATKPASTTEKPKTEKKAEPKATTKPKAAEAKPAKKATKPAKKAVSAPKAVGDMPDFKPMTLDEIKALAVERSIEWKDYGNDQITRMRLIMALKKSY